MRPRAERCPRSTDIADDEGKSTADPESPRPCRLPALLEAADVLIAFSPDEAEVLDKWVEGRVTLIPLGIDARWWSPPKGAEGRLRSLVSAGRDPSRSFATLVDAAAGLPVETTIVGSLAREQGLRDAAVAAGFSGVDRDPTHYFT